METTIYTLIDPRHSEPYTQESGKEANRTDAWSELLYMMDREHKHQIEISPHESWVAGFALETDGFVNLYNVNGVMTAALTIKAFYSEYSPI